MFGYTKVKLERDLVAKIKRYADIAGYSSVEEFITHALEKEIAQLEEALGVTVSDDALGEAIREAIRRNAISRSQPSRIVRRLMYNAKPPPT